MNISWSQRIFSQLHAEGLRDVVVCPGARNSPLVSVLSRADGFRTHSFFEERSGSFFALGIARRTGLPVAIVTTSGTAACELLPAAAEAFHTGVPLVLITADRPRRLRGTGAPQAIDQSGLFAKFVGLELDIENGDRFSLETWNRRAPLHLNVCFDEPLIDEPLEPWTLEEKTTPADFSGTSRFATSAGTEWAALRLTKFLRTAGTLVTVVGTLETDAEREATARFLKRLGAPVYLEATSGLRERADLRELALRSGDQLLAWALKRQMFQKVLRIGGVPTVRIWRDLDERECPAEVFSLSPLPFAGLSRGEMICAELAPVFESITFQPEPGALAGALFIKDRAAEAALTHLYQAEPLAEPSMVHRLSCLLASDNTVYVGNSLPIREWDLAAARESVHVVTANRGVNGIDGQIATFFGLAREDVENWCVIGDLTALYDLAGPWAQASRPGLRARIFVINNGGGKIFERIFKNDLFENRHAIEFGDWARMWKLAYQRWTSVPDSLAPVAGVEVIEVVPDEIATRQFWDRYDGIWA